VKRLAVKRGGFLSSTCASSFRSKRLCEETGGRRELIKPEREHSDDTGSIMGPATLGVASRNLPTTDWRDSPAIEPGRNAKNN